jgi:hypothetical protein
MKYSAARISPGFHWPLLQCTALPIRVLTLERTLERNEYGLFIKFNGQNAAKRKRKGIIGMVATSKAT